MNDFAEHLLACGAPELWRPVVGYESLYSVSSHGRVQSHGRAIIRLDGKLRRYLPRMLKPVEGKYLSLTLASADGKQSRKLIHLLVLFAFRGPPPSGYEGCHGDNDRHNNAAWNLRWDTRIGNHADKRIHGAHMAGEKHPNSVLTDEVVMEMRIRRANGATHRQLARDFNVSESTARMAARGQTWRHLQ